MTWSCVMDYVAWGVFGVVKAVAFVVDAVTFLPYFLLTKRTRTRVTKAIKAAPMSDKPDAPYRALSRLHTPLVTTLFPNCATVDDLFERAVNLFADNHCLGTRVCLQEMDEVQSNGKVFKKGIYGDYEWQTFSDVNTRVTNCGSGLKKLGHRSQEPFILFAETCADWLMCAQAGFRYNFPFATLYATLGDDSLVHMINETEARHVITTAELLPKFVTLISRLPTVTHIIYMDRYRHSLNVEFGEGLTVMSLSQLEQLGADHKSEPEKKPVRDDLAVIMYTSGSTGIPKGVMLSHGNVMCGCAGLSDRVQGLGPLDVYIGYLPLAHVLELASEISCSAHGTAIGYSSAQTITDTSTKIKKGCKGDISVLRPTCMTSVPLVLDRMYKAVWDKIGDSNPFAREFFRFAYKYKEFWLYRGYETPLLDALIFRKISRMLGGRLRIMLSGSAPLNHATQRFINVCFCVPLGQGYGLTETFGAACVMQLYDSNTMRVGHPVISSEIFLRDWVEGGYRNTDTPLPRGELCVGGGNVAVGYYKNPEKTAEDFMTVNGVRYFCTGDIGEIQTDGTVKIIDRKKDLVKLQAGEYVSLGKVETALKLCPVIEQICVYAESDHNFAVCFVVPNPKHLSQLAKDMGLNGASTSELCMRKDIEQRVLSELFIYARKAKLERFEIPTKIKLTAEPWTSEGGLLTEAFKLKRNNLKLYYQASIADMYS